jgi:hypothetical protein
VVFDHSTVIFISKGKRGGGRIKKSLVCKTQIVKVDRNKNVTLKVVMNKKNPEQIS